MFRRNNVSSAQRSTQRRPLRSFGSAHSTSLAPLLVACAALGCAPLGDLDGYAKDSPGPGTGSAGSAPASSPDPSWTLTDAGPGGDPPALADASPAPDSPGSTDATPPVGPRVASSIPADGARGIRRDTSLSIAFSAPMDRASVEAAFSSDTLPATALDFRWDSAGTLLDIALAEPLSYAAGGDASQVTALRYEYRLRSTAHDLEGNPLPDTRVAFWTLREISVALGAETDPALTGNWRSDGIYGTDSCAPSGNSMCLGDSSFGPNTSYRGFASFDLSSLPGELLEVSEAQLELQVMSILGDPFGGLGQLEFEHVRFNSIGPDAFSAAELAALGGVASAASGTSPRQSALDAVRSDLASAAPSQYRFRFQNASDGDAATDLLFSSRASVRLRVSYLIP
jgi:hypothetical protein